MPWQALQDERLILQDYASGSRPLIDAALSRLAIRANIVQEIGHPATLFPMVESGIGISVLPALALPLPQGSHLTVKRLTPVMERQLMLACRKNRSLSTAAQALWEIVREEGAKFNRCEGGRSAVSALTGSAAGNSRQDRKLRIAKGAFRAPFTLVGRAGFEPATN
ncbi:LysR substrate-binding domain-containing protein [Klebsiella variicola subsp. variicola]|nr:LysR substrate-binding domain-containing protein [Klebsiella variicola subsp. variicola]